jgi:hypothetical protein
MTDLEMRALAAAQRGQFLFFLIKLFELLHPAAPPLKAAWYIRAICHKLQTAWGPGGVRSAIAVPPRHLKSVIASVAWPAWLLGHDPSLKILVATYSEDLARQHAGDFRRVVTSPWYRQLFPGTVISSNGNRLLDMETTRGGSRKAVSVGGSVTGHGGDVIVIDDCMKADDVRSQARRDEIKAWYDGTLGTRLNALGGGTIISIQQRLHEDDLPAYLLEKGFELLNLPAIAERDELIDIGPGRVHRRRVGELLGRSDHNKAQLEATRRELGAQVFAAQYQQNPVTPEGNLIRLEWFKTYDERPERSWFHKVVQSWDTAMSSAPTADYSVCLTWGWRDHEWYLLDVKRERLEYGDFYFVDPLDGETLIDEGAVVAGEMAALGGDVPWSIVYAKDATIERSDQLVQRFARALEKGQAWLHDTAPAEVSELLARRFKSSSREHIERVVVRLIASGVWQKDMRISAAAVARYEVMMISYGLFDEAADLTALGIDA